MPRKLLLLVLIGLFVSQITAQKTAEPPKSKDDEKLEADAIVFLRETLNEVDGLRSVENRISFTSELAGLMWFHDEREARTMYLSVVANFKELLRQYDMQMNSYGITDPKETA